MLKTESLFFWFNFSLKFENNIYEKDKMKIRIEKSKQSFLKRIGISSEKINLSINIYDCNFGKINDKYFNHFNFLK